jgi:enamine deaminase RidA (YjgF/YER057c/UK114 family)
MAEVRIMNVPALGTPLGQYSHLARVKASEHLYIAGMLAADASGKVVGADDFEAQCTQVFANLDTALKSQGAGWGSVVQFMTFLVHSQDIPGFMSYRQREFPRFFPDRRWPPNTLLMVDRLVKEEFLIEVQAIAAL